jgi:hypothetical protein
MAEEPKLPTPMIPPEQVAEAILEAAVEGGRDVKVGAMSKMNTLTAKVAPSLGDRFSAMQAGRQQRDEPASRDPHGALDRPSEDGRTHGRAT